MKHVPKSAAKSFKNSDSADVLEYSLGDKDIDIAVVDLNGKYPDDGFVVNEECKELLYVVSGECIFSTKTQSVKIQTGDQVLIEKGELFKYDDARNLVLIAACTPAWRPEQHKEVK